MRLGLGLSICTPSAASAATGTSPADMSPTGLWGYPGNIFTAVPWANAGSAIGTMVDGGSPTVGAVFNGHNSADFNGSSQYLEGLADGGGSFQHWDNFVTRAAGFICAVFAVDTLPAASAHTYTDPEIVTDNGGNIGLWMNSSGIGMRVYDDATFKSTTAVPLSTTAKHCVMGWWDGSFLYCELDGVAATPLACGSLTTSYNVIKVRVGGDPTTAGVYMDGRIAMLMLKNSVPTLTQRASLRLWCQLNLAAP